MKIFDTYPENRLFSLDCLRGIDMLLLTVVSPLFVAFHRSWGLPDGVMLHFDHRWGVLGLYDLIMPCFIFMCGAAIPFAMGRRLKEGKPTKAFWTHLISRFLMLYLLGSIVQCNLLSLDPMDIHVFYNTLQVIAVAYVFSSLMLLVRCRGVQIASIPVLLVAMGLIVHFGGHGDYTPTGNFAYTFDRTFWGWFLPAGQRTLEPNGYYCYLLPQLSAFALTQLGGECARILRSARKDWVKVGLLTGIVALSFVLGRVAAIWVPVIKHIFSLSFSFYVIGWSVLALAVLFALTDIWKFRRGTDLVILFGQNALAAYLFFEIFCSGHLGSFCAEWFVQGLPQWLGAAVLPFAKQVVFSVMLILLVTGWSVCKRYRKI